MFANFITLGYSTALRQVFSHTFGSLGQEALSLVPRVSLGGEIVSMPIVVNLQTYVRIPVLAVSV